jgi:hypothetical protein
MNEEALRNDPELQRVLWACLECWLIEPVAPEQREVCHSWVSGPYERRFGGTFHQSRLRRLAELGFLRQGDTARSGNRRYYAIVSPEQVAELLTALGLPPTAPVAVASAQ